MPSSRYAVAGDCMLSRSQRWRSGLVHLVVDNETARSPGHTACYLSVNTERGEYGNTGPDVLVDGPHNCMCCAAGVPWPD